MKKVIVTNLFTSLVTGIFTWIGVCLFFSESIGTMDESIAFTVVPCQCSK